MHAYVSEGGDKHPIRIRSLLPRFHGPVTGYNLHTSSYNRYYKGYDHQILYGDVFQRGGRQVFNKLGLFDYISCFTDLVILLLLQIKAVEEANFVIVDYPLIYKPVRQVLGYNFQKIVGHMTLIFLSHGFS